MTNLLRENERVFPFITLPLPPTDNSLKIPVIRHKRGGKSHPYLVSTSAYKNYKKAFKVDWEIWHRQNPDFKLYEPNKDCFLAFTFTVYMKTWQTDAQNYCKALRDVLSGNLYKDDRYTYVLPTLNCPPQIDKNNPRIILDPNPTLLN